MNQEYNFLTLDICIELCMEALLNIFFCIDVKFKMQKNTITPSILSHSFINLFNFHLCSVIATPILVDMGSSWVKNKVDFLASRTSYKLQKHLNRGKGLELGQKVCKIILSSCLACIFVANITLKHLPLSLNAHLVLLSSCLSSALSLLSTFSLPTVSPLHLLLCLLFVHTNYLPFLLSTPYSSLLLFTLILLPHSSPSIPSLSCPSISFLHAQECGSQSIFSL